MLKITAETTNAIIDLARRGAPLETCGLLAGNDGVITFFYALTNVDASAEHFSLIPEEQVFAVKDARRRGLSILAVVHSHPASPARPSAEDIKLAYDPNILYLILSLQAPEPVFKAFRIKNGQVETEDLEILPDTGVYGQLRLPASVVLEVKGMRAQVDSFVAGTTDAVRFRAYRVPMGVYEQRQDGAFMARTRLSGGVANAGQLETLANLAERFGKGVLHFTTRQDLQLHDLPVGKIPDVFEALLEVGLVCRGGGGNTVRNITGSPLAGLQAEEAFDVLPYVIQVSEYLLPHASSYNLPRKYKIAFASAAEDESRSKVADLGFVALLKDGVRGFAVWAGGGMGLHSSQALQVAEFIPAEDAVVYAEAIKRLFDEQGDRGNKHKARLRFVVERLGAQAFIALVAKFVAQVRAENISVPDLRRRGHLRLGGEILAKLPGDVYPGQVPGRYSIRFRPFLGDVTSNQLRQIAETVKAYDLEFRADCEQGFYLAQARGEEVAEILKKLQTFYQPVPAAVPLACTGAATCRLGLCLSRGLAAAIRETVLSLPETKQSRLPRIKISGCPNSCGHHPIAELGFSGSARRVEGHLMPFYAVIRFPKNSEGNALGTKLGEIPAKAIPEFVRQLESLDTVQETLKKFQKIPTYEEAPDYYRDWGQTTDFSLAGRGPGECGAGVLDVIELDLKSAEADLQFAGESKKLYAAALSAMRALLVIRGVGAQVPREIFDAFRKHLIAPGWVEVDSEKVIEALLDYKLGDLSTLAHKEASIRALVARIRELYQSLDANLNFRVKAYTVVSPNLETGAAPAGSHRLDLRGTPCPMNFVLAKLELEKIPVGESLEVYLDEGDPIKNVPASFKDQGQDVAALGEAPGQGKSVTIRRKV